MLVTFFGYFRKSNTTAAANSPWSVGKCILAGDMRIDEQKYALAVTVRESKTRQYGRAPVVWIAGRRGHQLDPVAAWRDHLRLSAPTPASHAFAWRRGPVVIAMLHADLVRAAKQMAQRAGLDESVLAGHSFRRGGASFAFYCGVSEVLIQRHGDWESNCYRDYIALPAEHALLTTRTMLCALEDPRHRQPVMVPAVSPLGHVRESGEGLLD